MDDNVSTKDYSYIFCEYGLLPRIVSTWIVLVVNTPIVDILNIKPLLCYLVNIVLDKTSLKNYLTHNEAKRFFEPPKVSYASALSDIITLLWYSAAFVFFYPLGMVFSVIGIFLAYWTEKFAIIKTAMRSNDISKELIFMIIEIPIQYGSMAIIAISSLYFIWLFNKKSAIISTIMLGCVMFVMIISLLAWKACSSRRKNILKKSIHAKNTSSFPYLLYQDTYMTINPVYKIREKDVKSSIFSALEGKASRSSKVKTFIQKSKKR